MFNLIGLGEILWDLLPAGRQLGGAPANFAYHANALGAKGIVISRVGRDQNGTDIITRLEQLSLSTECIQVDSSAPTSTVSVELAPDGQPRYVIHENVSWDNLTVDENALLAVTQADAICFGALAQRSEQSRASIHELLVRAKTDTFRILDVNLRQHFYSAEIIDKSLRAANILKVNDAELPILAQLFSLSGDPRAQLTELARRYNLRLVACTRGAHGSLLVTESQHSDHPGIPAKVADTIGAGDSFTAAMT
ncbi:MAG TPA: carbohydrate kinase, partial [Candidatus Kapabacteria bacterium]|nr:carbohydrate kinase [Candidatus Kapabacteria bacterium]